MDLIRWFSNRHAFLDYFLILLSFSFIGILIRYLSDYSRDYLLHFCQNRDLFSIYLDYVNNQIPMIHDSLFYIINNNLRSSLIIFLFPLVIFVVISIISERIYPPLNDFFRKSTGREENFTMQPFYPMVKGLIFIIAGIWGFNTFDTYCLIKNVPIQIWLPGFFHAPMEIPTFICAGCLALMAVDYIRVQLEGDNQPKIKKMGLVIISTLKKFYIYMILISLGIIIAALVETYITPQIIVESFERFF